MQNLCPNDSAAVSVRSFPIPRPLTITCTIPPATPTHYNLFVSNVKSFYFDFSSTSFRAMFLASLSITVLCFLSSLFHYDIWVKFFWFPCHSGKTSFQIIAAVSFSHTGFRVCLSHLFSGLMWKMSANNHWLPLAHPTNQPVMPPLIFFCRWPNSKTRNDMVESFFKWMTQTTINVKIMFYYLSW